MNKRRRILLSLFLGAALLLGGCQGQTVPPAEWTGENAVPEYAGQPYVVLNDNIPAFAQEELTDQSFEQYSPLDDLGRCGPAVACIGTDLMPTQEREPIGQVKPTGWHTVKYDCVDGKYLYNRCHLIGFQLTGENANECNLITGTRYLNVTGMLPFENMTADYIKETGNHVLYRVTPVFEGDEPLARGVVIEALSVEDGGEGVCFHVYCYNVQPGVIIDYTDGSSVQEEAESGGEYYILNRNTRKFHLSDCPSVGEMKTEYRQEYTGTRVALEQQGYVPCGRCKP